MQALLDTLVLAQYGATALSAAFNCWYFATYRTQEGRRRVGAAVMAVVSLALVVESIANEPLQERLEVASPYLGPCGWPRGLLQECSGTTNPA